MAQNKKYSGRSATESDRRAFKIAQDAKPNFRIAEPFPKSDRVRPSVDAIVAERKSTASGAKMMARFSGEKGKDLKMVVMEPKTDKDARIGRRKYTVIVDDNRVVGEQG